MDSVRKGLRAGDIEKDTYERLQCAACEASLETRDDPDNVGQVRTCPECGSEWRRLG
ncbi:MAG: rRNA maturation endonuclease Nob1 [Halovenus sp.]|jgi:rRNA maturation endonuclease Nob1